MHVNGDWLGRAAAIVGADGLPVDPGETNIGLMRSIKRALDPQGILNPGKIFSL